MLAAADLRRRPLLGAVCALAVAVVTLSGCAAGQDAQTVEQTSVVDGTAFQAGDVALRDIGLRAPSGNSYAVGSNAYLEGLVVNRAAAADQLVSVTSPVATSVVFYADGVSALLGSEGSESSSPAATDSASPTDSGTPTTNTGAPTQPGTPNATGATSASGTPTNSSSPTGSGAAASASPAESGPEPLKSLPLATNQSVQFGYGNSQPAILLLGLKQALFPSQNLQLTFTFANGGSVTATVAVKLPVDSTLDAPTVNTEESEGSS